MSTIRPPSWGPGGRNSIGRSVPKWAVLESPDRLVDEPAAHPLGDRGRSFRHAKLLVEVLQVGLDCRGAQVDALTDLGRREPVGDQLEHLVLAVGEARARLAL